MTAKKKSYKFGKEQIEKKVVMHDPSNCGFTIKGYVLRWLSPGVQSRRGGRIWMPLRMSDLDPEFVREWQPGYNHLRCAQDGDTIRRNELVLSYASLEAAHKQRQQTKKQQEMEEGKLKSSKEQNVKKSGFAVTLEEQDVRLAPEGI